MRVSLFHQGTRLRSAPPGALPGSGRARTPAFGPLGAAADARPQWIGQNGGLRRGIGYRPMQRNFRPHRTRKYLACFPSR